MTASLDNVPRLSNLTRQELLHEHAYRGEPIVLTDAFERPPRDVVGDTRAEVMRRLADLRLPFRPEYGTLLMTCLRRGPLSEGTPDAVMATVAEYWEMVGDDPETPVMCAEEPTPESVLEQIGVPSAARDDDMRSTMFIGNAGNVAPIHFDGDCRHVLLHQLFGRKLVIVLPVEAAPALRSVVNFSTLWLRGLAEADRPELVRRLGGWECVLEPGETVLMPALVWHGVIYLDDGMSVNYRFGRHRRHRFVSEHLHLDDRVQAFAGATVDPGALVGDGPHAVAWRRLVDCWAEPAPTPGAKYEQIGACLEGCLDLMGARSRELGLDVPGEFFAPLPDVVVQALRRAHLFKERLYLHRSLQDVSAWY